METLWYLFISLQIAAIVAAFIVLVAQRVKKNFYSGHFIFHVLLVVSLFFGLLQEYVREGGASGLGIMLYIVGIIFLSLLAGSAYKQWKKLEYIDKKIEDLRKRREGRMKEREGFRKRKESLMKKIEDSGKDPA